MKQERLDAVWAAVYVRVLSATPPNYPPDDHNIHGQAECLGDPTAERMEIAIKAADSAVRRLAVARKKANGYG